MFDSLQHYIAGTAASTATIGGTVAVAFIAAAGSFFRRFDAWREHPAAATGHCQAVWSSKATTNAAQTARQGGGYRWATWPARRRDSAVVCGDVRVACCVHVASLAIEKSADVVAIFLVFYAGLSACHVCS